MSHGFIVHIDSRINMFLGNNNRFLSIVLDDCHFIFEGSNYSRFKLGFNSCHDYTFRCDTVFLFKLTSKAGSLWCCIRLHMFQLKSLIVFSMIVFMRILFVMFLGIFLDELSSRIELHIIITNLWTSKSSSLNNIILLDYSTRSSSSSININSNINVTRIDIITLQLCSMIINMLGLTSTANFTSFKIFSDIGSGYWCIFNMWHKIWEFKCVLLCFMINKLIMRIMTLKSFESSHAT